MGSSPVTATIPPVGRIADRCLHQFLHEVVGWQPGGPLVVAFSGGPDSTALLAATVDLVADAGPVYAAHLDHRLDAGSTARAQSAKRIAEGFGARWVVETADPPHDMPQGAEHWARCRRYAFLEQARKRYQAAAILTAHHQRDQAETVLLRLLYGSGLNGLAGIQPWAARVGRPWLDLPPDVLHRRAAESGVEPIYDPTNLDLSVPRNRIRHRLFPRLRQADSKIESRLARLAHAAAWGRDCYARRLETELDLKSRPVASLDLDRLLDLPQALWPLALALLSSDRSLVGEQQPSGVRRSELGELARQLEAGGRVEVTVSSGYRWLARDRRLHLESPRRPEVAEPFCHSLPLPGEVELPDGGRVEVSAAEPQPWMTSGEARRTALEMEPGVRLKVRSRRAGDRIQPLGSSFERKLKDVLIDAKVPRAERDRLPLVVADDQPVWVPGVTIDHRFRMRGEYPLWVAHWHPR